MVLLAFRWMGLIQLRLPDASSKRPPADQPMNKIPCSTAQPNPTPKVEDNLPQDAEILARISLTAAGTRVSVFRGQKLVGAGLFGHGAIRWFCR
jgi:hypothetical protein